MAKKMLIDATHPEETRVVVVDGNRVDDFDFESENKRQLAGNIYLAKVTRVEPSLQAAFVEYGGNRHGFLAFAEIHPDYYQIPIADRQAILAEERELARQADEDEERGRGRSPRRSSPRPERAGRSDATTSAPAADDPGPAGMDVIDLDPEAPADEEGVSPAFRVAETPVETPAAEAGDDASDAAPADGGAEAHADGHGSEDAHDRGTPGRSADIDAETAADEGIESVGEEDVQEEIAAPRHRSRARRYKIQEVIKVRQILLVQVVKEERGNKGAALTTYLSLAGRYCVLMPNTARGGGISRKITNAVDRKKLKEIAGELEVPDGAGLIIRTAGSQRTKAEIKRDYEYLQRLWEQIRELTLKSIAPAKIYEEGDLIKRSIRDLYSKDIDEVIVEGEAGFRSARDFMKMIMPSHAKNVKLYVDTMPLFARYQVESYLSGMFNPTVQLKSGGYIVIGVTEALVAIDVNSGRATKEGSIEQTALNTNLEAAEEIARQLRLRDLAGLIVVDFIDMEERKNNAAVEKRFKDKLKTDRARIQVGRISGFGLLEMSRQRLRPGMLEATTQPCPHCHGTGLIRSDDSMALTILRQIEEEGTRGRSKEVVLKAPVGIVNYLMNHKREHIAQIEGRYGMAVRVEADPFLISPDFSLEKLKVASRVVQVVPRPVVTSDASMFDDAEEIVEETEVEEDAVEVAEVAATVGEAPAERRTAEAPEGDGTSRPKKRRRRRRKKKPGSGNGAEGAGVSADGAQGSRDDDDEDGDDEGDEGAEDGAQDASQDGAPDGAPVAEVAAPAPDPAPARRVTRTRKPRGKAAVAAEAPAAAAEAGDIAAPAAGPVVAEATADAGAAPVEGAPVEGAPVEAAKPKATRSRSRKPKATAADSTAAATDAAPDAATAPEPDMAPEPAVAAAPEAAPAPEPGPVPAPAPAAVAPEPAAPPPAPVVQDGPPKPKRRGWWSLGG
jgi:ribonuclease E